MYLKTTYTVLVCTCFYFLKPASTAPPVDTEYLEFLDLRGNLLYTFNPSLKGVCDKNAKECGISTFKNYTNISQVCGVGVFLFYSEPAYTGTVFVFASNKSNTCVGVAGITKAHSFQFPQKPSGESVPTSEKSVAFFRATHFNYRYHTSTNSYFASKAASYQKSLLIIGAQTFKLRLKENDDGEYLYLCIKTQDKGPLTICLLPNFDLEKMFSPRKIFYKDYEFLDVNSTACSGLGDVKQIELKRCFGLDTGAAREITECGETTMSCEDGHGGSEAGAASSLLVDTGYLDFLDQRGNILYTFDPAHVCDGRRYKECGLKTFQDLKNVDHDKITETCGKGVFIFYSETSYTGKAITFAANHTSTCTKDPAITKAQSFQFPLKNDNNFRKVGRTVALFNQSSFNSPYFTEANALITYREDDYYPSLILIGPQTFAIGLKGTDGWDHYYLCLNTMDKGPLTICPVPKFDLVKIFNPERLKYISFEYLEIDAVKSPCSSDRLSDKVKHIDLNGCYGLGDGPVKDITDCGDFTEKPCGDDGGGNKSQCSGNYPIDLELKDILDLRRGSEGGGKGENNNQIITKINDTSLNWMFDLFETSLEIWTKVCKAPLIDQEFMTVFAYIYYKHFASANHTIARHLPMELEMLELEHDMAICKKEVVDNKYEQIYTDTLDVVKNYRSLSEIKATIEKRFQFNKGLDYVMELNWLMGNLVASVCSHVHNYDANFYWRFLHIYYDLYFIPLSEQWGEPGTYEQYYKYAFGGYGMDKMLVQLSLCTYNALEYANSQFMMPRALKGAFEEYL